MTVYDFITAHPDDHIRVIRCADGSSSVMFDSTTGTGDLESLLLEELDNGYDLDEPAPDGVYELEYTPNEY